MLSCTENLTQVVSNAKHGRSLLDTASFFFARIFLFFLLRHNSPLALSSLATHPHFVLSKDLVLFSSLFLILFKLKMFT
jgi:hypothetical protein